jgi:outer membrane immunogenic protein
MRLVLAAAAAATLANPAVAQELVPFNGAHVEGLIGYESQQGPFDGDAGKSDGIVYGVAAGYDVRSGNLVLGAEAELTGASVDTRGDGLYAPDDRLTVNSGRDLYAGGRIGYVVAPRAMLYGKLGYTNARSDLDYGGSVARPAFEESETSGGIRVGGGAEVQISGNTFAKAEYRYSDYGSSAIEHRHQLLGGFGFRF